MQTTLNILETVLLVLAILVALGLAATIAIALLKVLRTKRDGKKDPDGELELTNLDKELSDRVREVKRSFLSEKQRKKLPKDKGDKSYDSTVFVVDFHPSLRAHEVD